MCTDSSEAIGQRFEADSITLCTMVAEAIDDDVAVDCMNSRLLRVTSRLVLPFHNKIVLCQSFFLIESVADFQSLHFAQDVVMLAYSYLIVQETLGKINKETVDRQSEIIFIERHTFCDVASIHFVSDIENAALNRK